MHAAAKRLAEAFSGSPESLRSWLNLVLLNAKTTMVMLFQDPFTDDPKEASSMASASLLENARQLIQQSGINTQQADEFIKIHQQAIDDFNRAMELALNRGAKDRPTQVLMVAQILRLPIEPLENVDEDTWFDRLDEMDEAARKRRERQPEAEAPTGKSRDQIAEWLARKHLTADNGIREIWYLKQAPANEIRFLEVNDRLSGANGVIEPIDFGLDIDGVNCRLFVADITSEQLGKINSKTLSLPKGWTMADATKWGRRR